MTEINNHSSRKKRKMKNKRDDFGLHSRCNVSRVTVIE